MASVKKSDIQKNFSRVLCYYTGGGVYVYSAKYKDIYLYGSLDEYIFPVPVRGELIDYSAEIIEEAGYTDELHTFSEAEIEALKSKDVRPSDNILPTWKEILLSIKYLNESDNIDTEEAEMILKEYNPNLNKTII